MMFQELNPILEKIANKAKADGAEAEVMLTREEKFSVTMDKGKLGKFDSGLSHCAGLRVIKDGAEGYCSTESLSETALLESYKEALESARFSASQGERDEALGLIGAGAKGMVETLKSGFGQARTVEQKIEVARRLEDASLKKDKRIAAVPWNAYVESSAGVRVFNTKGVDCAYERGSTLAYAYALAREGDESRTGAKIFFSYDENEFDPVRLGEEAAEKAVLKLGSVQPPTGVFPVLLDLEPASELLGLMVDYLSGKTVAERRSLFGENLGQAIASSALTMIDDPFVANGLASRPFDSEGTPSRQTPLIENGVLKSFLLNSVYARKLKMPNTGHAARGPKSGLGIGATNIVVQPGTESRAALLKRYPRTILITDLTGLHAGFQAGSGDFSLQAAGEMWENGTRIGPLCNFVFSGNFKELLKGIEAVANRPPRPFSDVITPELLISKASIAGKSGAS